MGEGAVLLVYMADGKMSAKPSKDHLLQAKDANRFSFDDDTYTEVLQFDSNIV